MPRLQEPTPQEEETRRISKAAGDITRLILAGRDDWMLDRAELVGVMAYVTAYLTAEIATEAQLKDRTPDAEAIFIEIFRKHFAASVDAKKMMRFL